MTKTLQKLKNMSNKSHNTIIISLCMFMIMVIITFIVYIYKYDIVMKGY